MTSAWKRATAFGSLWAASEIVLGSLVHGLRVPLAGTLLAAIGVAILVAGLRLRGGPGVALRAGIVCALMKSVSPGAVVIGPMIGIMLEASIIEGVTRLTGRNIPGMLLAGALATATPIVQKIGGLLVTYGFNAATIYVGLYEFAADTLGARILGPVDLIVVLVAAAAVLGTVAAATGLRIAALARRTTADALALDPSTSAFRFDAPSDGQRYSVPLLAVHIISLGAGLALVAMTPLWIAAIPVAAYAGLSFARYRRVARKFAQPRIWLEFAVIAVLAALALGGLSPGRSVSDGVYAGGQMVARGILVIVALSSIGVELRNPAVLGWFLGKGLGNIAEAIGIAARALPGIIRLLGDERQALRHPVRALSRCLAATVAWIDEDGRPDAAPVFILSGGQGTGKTTTLEQVVHRLRAADHPPCGFLSPVVRDGDDRIGYDLRLLSDGTSIPLARREASDGTSQAGPFTFFEDAIRSGRAELVRARPRPASMVIVDEVGPLEMLGQGWTPALLPLILARTSPLLMVIRSSLVDEVCSRWNLAPAKTWDASASDATTIWNDLRPALTERALYSRAPNRYLAEVAR